MFLFKAGMKEGDDALRLRRGQKDREHEGTQLSTLVFFILSDIETLKERVCLKDVSTGGACRSRLNSPLSSFSPFFFILRQPKILNHVQHHSVADY